MTRHSLQHLMMQAHRAWADRYPRKAYAAGYTKEVKDLAEQAADVPLQGLPQPQNGGERKPGCSQTRP